VISPTHKQSEAVTDEIRSRMRKAGLIGKKEITVASLVNLNLTAAEKSDLRNLDSNHVIQFNQNLPGIKRGSQWQVKEIAENSALLKDKDGNVVQLPLNKSASYDILERKQIGISKGDKLRISRNGFDEDKRRMNNGEMLDVVSVKKNGNIVLQNPISKQTYKIDKEFVHIAHAHCITSYAAQGKTVDEVFISQPGATFGATDAKQFYVSISRGRDNARIYTDDKQQLLEHASKMGERQSAMELVKHDKTHLEHVLNRERTGYRKTPLPERAKIEPEKTKFPTIERDYEPGI